MKKESVNKFDLEAAFKALEEIEIPVVKGVKPNRVNLQERFTKKLTSEVLIEDYYDVNDQSDLEAAQEEREAEIAKAKLARIEKIVDLEAESEEDLLPSYVGKVIIQCPQCMTLFYKNQEDIATSEENPEVVNINEICQHCGNSSGYTLIGKVDKVGEDEAENYDVEDFDENELNLDFEDVEEPSEEESIEDNVEDVAAEEGNEEELELEPVEEVEETSEEEEEVKESLTLNEEVEEEITEDEITSEEESADDIEISYTPDGVKELAVEAGEEIAEEVKENPEISSEEIEEIVNEVVDTDVEELKAESTDEESKPEEVEEPIEDEEVTESLNEAVDKELDTKLKAHNEYIEYLKDMIEKEEKSLANAKNDFVKKSLRSRIDALKADLEEALPEALKTEVEPDLPTAEEIDLEATQNTEEKEETKESLTETTAIKPRIRHQSKREIFSRELAAHPAFGGLSTRDVERYIIDLYLEDDPTAELDVDQVIEYVEDLGWGKIILDNIDNLSESQVKHFAQKDPVFVSTIKEFLGDWLIPNKNYSMGALVSELLIFLGKKPADREEAKDFKFDPNDASYKEFKDELADAYYEAKRLVPVGEALVGDVNINLDARGQSVGLLKGQGGEVHNDMTEDKENLDEFIGPAVASIAGAAGAASVANSLSNAVSSLVSEDVEDATKVRKGSKVEYLAMELAKQDFFKDISVQIIQRILIPSYIEEFGRDNLTIEEVIRYFSDYGFGGFVLDNYFDLSLKHIKTLGKQDPRFVEALRKYCEKHNMTPDEADYEKGKFNEFEELFDLSLGTVFEANGELETIEELQEIYKELTPVAESLQESGDLDTLLDSEEFKKPISDAEVENILAKYESLEEDVEPGIESELAIQDIVDTWESVEEIDEESLDKLTENYLTEVYSNVKSFKTTDCALEENKLVVEGKITFNSGKEKNTKFVFEAKKENNKIILEGLNADFATEKAFVLNCNLDTANRLVVESLSYKYTINNTLVEGLTK